MHALLAAVILAAMPVRPIAGAPRLIHDLGHGRPLVLHFFGSKDGLFDRARGRLVGSEQYLTKPFTKDELLGAIVSHVAK